MESTEIAEKNTLQIYEETLEFFQIDITNICIRPIFLLAFAVNYTHYGNNTLCVDFGKRNALETISRKLDKDGLARLYLEIFGEKCTMDINNIINNINTTYKNIILATNNYTHKLKTMPLTVQAQAISILNEPNLTSKAMIITKKIVSEIQDNHNFNDYVYGCQELYGIDKLTISENFNVKTNINHDKANFFIEKLLEYIGLKGKIQTPIKKIINNKRKQKLLTDIFRKDFAYNTRLTTDDTFRLCLLLSKTPIEMNKSERENLIHIYKQIRTILYHVYKNGVDIINFDFPYNIGNEYLQKIKIMFLYGPMILNVIRKK